MKYYSVIFKGTPNKEYCYKTKFTLPIGAECTIVADNETAYKNPVVVIKELTARTTRERCDQAHVCIREITDFKIIRGLKRPSDKIKKVIFNEEKRTTCVLWIDGSKTTIKCQPNDIWDKEKALALCYMKRVLGNRGSFNETLKRFCYDED